VIPFPQFNKLFQSDDGLWQLDWKAFPFLPVIIGCFSTVMESYNLQRRHKNSDRRYWVRLDSKGFPWSVYQSLFKTRDQWTTDKFKICWFLVEFSLFSLIKLPPPPKKKIAEFGSGSPGEGSSWQFLSLKSFEERRVTLFESIVIIFGRSVRPVHPF
jgi:hypothetical protein